MKREERRKGRDKRDGFRPGLRPKKSGVEEKVRMKTGVKDVRPGDGVIDDISCGLHKL